MFTDPLFEIKLHLLNTVFLSGFQSSVGALKSTEQGSNLVNFMGLAGRVNTAVYKTEPIFTGLGHSELS